MPSENIIFQKLSPGDLRELKEISKRTFKEAFGADNNPQDLELYLNTVMGEENLRRELMNPLSEFYFAKLNGITAGYFKINLGDAQTEFREKDAMELERLYVISQFQNKKIGQRILDSAIEMAIQRKMTYLWLGVWEKNLRAIEFYKRNGFEITGTHPYVVGNDLQTDKIMKLFLK